MSKNGKRILSVKVFWELDESPDTSWLGEYSDKKTSDFSIDRAHAEDCQIQTYNPLPPNETTHNIDIAYARATGGTCEDCEASPEECFAAPCEYYERECTCGERGSMRRSEFRYFNPSFNYVDKQGNPNKGETAETVRKYTLQDYERMEALSRGDWCFMVCFAQAEITIPTAPGLATIQRIRSFGLGSIESDSDKGFREETETEQLADLRATLKGLGFGTRAISAAYKQKETVAD